MKKKMDNFPTPKPTIEPEPLCEFTKRKECEEEEECMWDKDNLKCAEKPAPLPPIDSFDEFLQICEAMEGKIGRKLACQACTGKYKEKKGKAKCSYPKKPSKLKCKKFDDISLCQQIGCEFKKNKCNGNHQWQKYTGKVPIFRVFVLTLRREETDLKTLYILLF